MKLWLMITGLLALLAFLKVGVRVVYHDAFAIKFKIGRFRFSLFGKKSSDENKTPPKSGSQKKTKRNWKPLLNAVFEKRSEILFLIGRILTTPTLDDLMVHIEVGAEEPDKCALKYGEICSVVGILLAGIENTFTVKKRRVDILCCFDKADLQIDAEVEITLRVYEIIALAAAALKLGFGIYRQGKSNKKVV